jgi:hypothetical protein
VSFSWSRLATWAIALVVGVAYGLAGTIAQSYVLSWVPLGLILAVIGSAALLLAVRLLSGDRWAALAVGLGMMAATLVFSGRGPGGSVIVPQAPEGQVSPGLVWTIAVPILVALAVAWPNTVHAAPAASTPPEAN